jgi:hypothetical protein
MSHLRSATTIWAHDFLLGLPGKGFLSLDEIFSQLILADEKLTHQSSSVKSPFEPLSSGHTTIGGEQRIFPGTMTP